MLTTHWGAAAASLWPKKWFGNPGHAALPFKKSIDASISLTDLKAKTASLLDFSALCPIF